MRRFLLTCAAAAACALMATAPPVAAADATTLRVSFSAPDTATRLQAIALQDTSTDLVGLALIRALRATSTPAELTRHVDDYAALGAALGRRARLAAGDRLLIELVPGEGLRLSINGAVLSGQFGNAEFFRMLARGWNRPPTV